MTDLVTLTLPAAWLNTETNPSLRAELATWLVLIEQQGATP